MWKKITAVIAACLTLFALANAYILWGGFGAWMPFTANENLPVESNVIDPRYTMSGAAAIKVLADHRAAQGFPSITAAVAVDGQLVWSGAAGWANVEEQTAATATTRYRIGSTSKAVTASALARLVDAGELDLDRPIADYLEDIPQPWWQSLTLRMLASHTAGFPDYAANKDLAGLYVSQCGCVAYDSVTASLALIDGNTEPLYEPGTEFFYSSYDLNVIGAVLEQSQNKHYLDVLQDTVLKPLGLTRTTGGLPGNGESSAAFYEIRPGEIRRWRDFDLTQRLPGGGIYSTSAELVQVGSAWLNDRFISAATRDTMLTPQRLANGDVNPQSYAVGWRYNDDTPHPLDPDQALPRFHHGGVNKGAMSWLVVYPTEKLAVAVNINTRAPTFSEFAKVEKALTRLFLAAALPNG